MGIEQIGIDLGPSLGGAFTDYMPSRWCEYFEKSLAFLVHLIIYHLLTGIMLSQVSAFTQLPVVYCEPPFFSTTTIWQGVSNMVVVKSLRHLGELAFLQSVVNLYHLISLIFA
jgi:hypothetical protein